MYEIAIELAKGFTLFLTGGGLMALLTWLRKPKEDAQAARDREKKTADDARDRDKQEFDESRERDKKAFRRQWLSEIERLHNSHAEVEKRFNDRCDEVVELMAENIMLKSKNATLEARVTTLEARITELESFRKSGS